MQARLQLALYLPGWYSLWVDAVHTANTKKCEEEIMMLAKEFTFEVVSSLSETDRGEGGFGHTGNK